MRVLTVTPDKVAAAPTMAYRPGIIPVLMTSYGPKDDGIKMLTV
jgi:hypothetical protein